MHLLLTGAAGKIGAHVLQFLLDRQHTVETLDISDLTDEITSKYPSTPQHHHVIDLSDIQQIDSAFTEYGPFEGVIHFAAIPNPLADDWRVVHNNNVTASFNVMCTAMMKGVKRVTIASSVNATGMSFTREGKQVIDKFPMTEEETYRAEDAYGLSKQ